MLVVGVTGGSGSGKTSISEALGSIAGNSIDADAVYHELIEKSIVMRKEIFARFPQTQREDNTLDRKKLAQIVFSDAQALADLNEITHKYVVREIEKCIGESYRSNKEMAIVDAAALFESGADKLCDVTVGVIASRELRIKRIMERDGLDIERASARIDAQQDDRFYYDRCDYIVETDEKTDISNNAAKLYDAIMEGMKLPNEQ